MNIDPQRLALPTIHLNGTGAQSLQAEYEAVRLAAESAIEALENATCNGRDFYPQPDAAWKQARAEREAAFAMLQQVVDYAAMWEEKAADHLREKNRRLAP